jgi:hypothetical protein
MALHHIRAGASEINLYLDRPAPRTMEMLRPFPQVRFTLCDDAYWQDDRPEKVEARQVINATDAYRRTKTDWLLHCDADEFVGGRTPLAVALSKLAPTDMVARLQTAERVTVIGQKPRTFFDGPFRLCVLKDRKTAISIYGEMNDYLNAGVTGHSLGKVLVRTGQSFRLGLHYARPKGAGQDVTVPDITLPEHVLLHYDGLTSLHYLNKFIGLKRLKGTPKRKLQAQVLNDLSETPELLREFLNRLRSLSPEQADALRTRGLLIEDVVLPDTAVAEMCPEARIDPEAFDAKLRADANGRLDDLPAFD